MVERQVAVVGFPKCGTMSLLAWSKNKYPGATTSRPENIYNLNKFDKDYSKWICLAITRDPINRIKSGIQYWPRIRKEYYENGIEGVLKGFKRYDGVGFGDPIEQSNYDKYIKRFEKRFNMVLEVFRFEDMIKLDNFPHVNESTIKVDVPEKDLDIIRQRLKEADISY